MRIVYLNGTFLPEEEAAIPITDRGFLYGDGVFVTMLLEEGQIFFYKTHLAKLEEQCHSFHLQPSHTSTDALLKLIALNHAERGVWRVKIIVTGGENPSRSLPLREPGQILMTLEPYSPLKKEALETTLYPIPAHTAHAGFKSLAHLNRFFVTEYAFKQGKDDCVTTTEKGLLLETSFGNLLWEIDGHYYAPAPSLPLYYGVTLSKIHSLKTIEPTETRLEAIPSNAALYRTNTLEGIIPIASMGEKKFTRHLNEERCLKEQFRSLAISESLIVDPASVTS